MRRSLAALALAFVLPLPAVAGDVVVRPGETLSEIADRYGMSVTRLIQLNAIRDPDHLEAGTTLKIPGSSRAALTGGGGSITVREGETLSEIADRHGMSLTRLMQINGIDNPDHVEAGMRLKLQPVGSRSAASATAQRSYSRGAREHVVRSGETLSVIADGYGVPLSKLIAINAISNPDHVEEGTRLRLKAPTPAPSPAASSAPARPAAATSKPRPAATPATAIAPAKATTPATTTTTATAAAPYTAVMPRNQPASIAAAPQSAAAQSPGHQNSVVSSQAPVANTQAPIARTPISQPAASQTPVRQPVVRQPAVTMPAANQPAVSLASVRRSVANPAATTTTSPANTRVTVPTAATSRPVATVATATASPARTPAKADWRTYGPLQIDWANWQPMGGSLVAPTLNSQGQSLYLAINCGARKLNATSAAGQWKSWDDPQTDFEEQMISDLCKARS